MSDDIEDDDRSKKDKNKASSADLAVQNIMQHEWGRTFIWEQLQSTGVFESIFDNDAIKHAYNSGMRDSGLRLNRLIKEATPDYYIKMVKENIDG